MGHHDTRLGQVGEPGAGRPAHEVGQYALRHVADVGGALAQVGVLHVGQGVGIFFRRRVKGVLGRDQILTDEARHFLEQHRVFQHEQVRVEDQRLLGAHRLAQSVLHGDDLAPCVRQRCLEPLLLLGPVSLDDAPLGRVDPRAVKHHHTAAAHPLRCGDAAQHFFACLALFQHAREGSRGPKLRKGN